MKELIIYEKFDSSAIDNRLTWFNPPNKWLLKNSRLRIEPDAKTDFWQNTYYDFVADNGHFLYEKVTGDFIITTRLWFNPVHQYDQAGLMVRISSRCWIKVSVEYEIDEPSKLGAVVTNNGYSDWSTQNFYDKNNELELRIKRKSSDYIVEYLKADSPEKVEFEDNWTQIRMTHLQEDTGDIPLLIGIYACSPKKAGYTVEFDLLKIEKL